MEHVILVRYGEIALKGLNRNYFIELLAKNIRNTLRCVPSAKVKRIQGRIIVDIEEADLELGLERIQKVFGIVSVSPAFVIDSDIDVIEENAIEQVRSAQGVKTFKITAKRGDKTFPIKSPDLNCRLGEVILDAVEGVSVDIHNPDLNLWVEVRQKTYMYHEFIPCNGGMPVGCSGKGALLLSGGIDSPVAGYLMAKRGVEVIGVYFHSFPFTSDRAKQKVIDLAKIMSQYCGKIKLYVVPFTEIQTKIVEKCPDRQTTIIIRRYMMRIAEMIAEKEGAKALITGESLGQVASQTMEGLGATNAVANLPVFRPLIGFDKADIVAIAERIGTFETSILPYEDCCTIFVPKHPETRPKIPEMLRSEEAIAEMMVDMMATAVENSEIIKL
ncbi:tRNA 4-thiouridine(8) synthase ThiI [Acetobacterium fimetarium]|uniref:Probable tRNA sulfurtransferase n=1 Tax=Acetobacterium fimetarium TaxID=52691 RepID=A0ABR6WXW3_9FIRM|nr:tRNA uracil 4-sulfurtransferase ThiI [Acetobacterium fimetarium]MBC3805447.1 tRNA 4-thiouridine(8) synthase ThiI [Acetobacterium fimetarium]